MEMNRQIVGSQVDKLVGRKIQNRKKKSFPTIKYKEYPQCFLNQKKKRCKCKYKLFPKQQKKADCSSTQHRCVPEFVTLLQTEGRTERSDSSPRPWENHLRYCCFWSLVHNMVHSTEEDTSAPKQQSLARRQNENRKEEF